MTPRYPDITVELTAGDAVELQGNFRRAHGYFAGDHTFFWGIKIGCAAEGGSHYTTPIRELRAHARRRVQG